MDSKQLSQLGKTNTPAITLSEVYGLINQQILIGKMSVASLKLQAEYCTALKNAQDYTIAITGKKITLVNKLNALREEQLREFDEIRQLDCNDIIAEINDLDVPTPEYFAICKQLEDKKTEQNYLVEKINALQNSLPDEKMLDFYKVKPKTSYNVSGTCATESSVMD